MHKAKTPRLTKAQLRLLIEIVGGDVLTAHYAHKTKDSYGRTWQTRRGVTHHATCIALYAKGLIFEQTQYADTQVFKATPYGVLIALQIVSKERFSKEYARGVRKAKRLAEKQRE